MICSCCGRGFPTLDGIYGTCHECAVCCSLGHDPCCHGRCASRADKANSADRCASGLCSAHVTHHSGDCEVRRLLAENTRLVALLEAAQLDAAAERGRRIEAECDRNKDSPCGLCYHGEDCELWRSQLEARRLMQEAEQLREELLRERRERIQAELERERFRTRLAEGRAN